MHLIFDCLVAVTDFEMKSLYIAQADFDFTMWPKVDLELTTLIHFYIQTFLGYFRLFYFRYFRICRTETFLLPDLLSYFL